MQLITALHEKSRHLARMQGNLLFSQNRVQRWWKVETPFANWSEEQLESLAAFKMRFAELQDHLAAAMKMIASIENEDVRTFTYVLNYMEQIELLDDMQHWQQVRDLRNAATHDYSEGDDEKSRHFDLLLQSTAYLLDVLKNLNDFVLKHYGQGAGTKEET